MQFKTTVNNETGNTTYFIDGKKVSRERYDFRSLLCKRKDSFLTEIKQCYTHHYFSGYSN